MFLLALLACKPDTNLQVQYPEAATSLTVLDFGEVPVAYSSTLSFELINTGRVDLEVADVITDDTLGAYDVVTAPSVVAPGERELVEVQFHPPDYTTYASTLAIQSDDPDNPTLTVALTGVGGDVPTPDIATDVASLDFGTVAAGGVGTAWFILSNEGDGTLEVSGMTQSGSGAFAVVGDLAYTLDPGESTNIIVTYQPTTDLGDNGRLTITSNDPDEPTTEVVFVGNGGGDFEYPVAVIDGPETTEPRQILTLDGTGSYDPQGYEPLTYEWSLVGVPDGSQATLSEPNNLDMAYLPTDIAGLYMVQLKVTNTLGIQSAPAVYMVDAIPNEELHVELVWNTGGADLDLHLLTSEGEMFVEPYDCTWCNQNPEWGGSGSADNPSLDLDDLSGYGPENVNIDAPADDSYFVRVHYFTDNGDDAVVATARIYTYGELVGEFSKVMERNDIWEVAEVRWPDGVAIEETTELYDAGTERVCHQPD